MIYVLAIGIDAEVYQNPSLEIFLNDNFLETINFKESIPVEYQKHKKIDMAVDWGMDASREPEKMYNILMPKKWLLYEIDDRDLKEKNDLDIEFKNLRTNITNGFMTKMDKCRVIKTIFMPKDWFSSIGILEIFNHCDARNIVIEPSEGPLGWPSAYSTVSWTMKMNGESKIFEESPTMNKDLNYRIIYDQRLELYRFDDPKDIVPVHIKIADIPVLVKELNAGPTPVKAKSWSEYKFQAYAPQKPAKTNSETTLLQLDYKSKLYINQLTTKYQHNED